MRMDIRNTLEHAAAARLDARRARRGRIVLVLMAVIALAMFALPILAVAQDVVDVAAEPFPIEGVVAGLIAILTPVVLWGIKKVPFMNLPTWTLPILAGTVIPMLLNWIATLAANPEIPWYAAPLLGLVGVGLREVIDQLAKIGRAKQTAPTPEA